MQRGHACIRACPLLLVLMLRISGDLLMCDLQQRLLLSGSGMASASLQVMNINVSALPCLQARLRSMTGRSHSGSKQAQATPIR